MQINGKLFEYAGERVKVTVHKSLSDTQAIWKHWFDLVDFNAILWGIN